MSLWDQFLAWLGLTQPSADGSMNSIPGPLPGPAGAQGAPGTPGSIWYNGAGAPSNSIGVDGNYYLDTTSGDVYFKVAGSWT